MEFAAVFVTSFVAGFSGAMMPGPMLTLTIAETPRRGLRAAPLLVLGHGLVEAAVVIGLVLGLSQVVRHSTVSGMVALVGGAVLVWMGYGMGMQAWRGAVSLDLAAGAQRHGPGPVPAGALVSASNPYWLLWWATVGATYVASSLELGTVGLASFFGGHILSDLVWFTLVGGLVVTGRRALNDRVYRGLILVCAVFLVGLGAYFVASGVTFLRG